jgi:hypothetical protein
MAFACNARYSVRALSIPLTFATRSKIMPNSASLSRIKDCGTRPCGGASRGCCANQTSVRCRVAPKSSTRRELGSIMENTCTVQKRVNHRQEVTRIYVLIMLVQKRVPSLGKRMRWWEAAHVGKDDVFGDGEARFEQVPCQRSSPRIRSAPHMGFSVAICRMSAIKTDARRGRPARARDLSRQKSRKTWRCHWRSVSG